MYNFDASENLLILWFLCYRNILKSIFRGEKERNLPLLSFKLNRIIKIKKGLTTMILKNSSDLYTYNLT